MSTRDTKRKAVLIALFTAAFGLGGYAVTSTASKPKPVASGGSSAKESPAATEDSAGSQFVTTKVSESRTGVTATSADDWSSEFSNQYETFMQNDENDEIIDYTEQDPQIKTIYEGYGFAKSYGSARGHTYDLVDLYATGRPHKLANCFTCKSSDFTAKVLSEGDSVYALNFEDVKGEISDPFGCFHCHENEPGTQYLTHTYLANALGDDVDKVDARTESCGQCHSEYYFDPKTSATTLGYHGLSEMNPEQILANENALTQTDENGNTVMFADWVDESTGTRKLKAQHPEFETYLGEGSIHAGMDLTCADCHMAKEKDKDGNTYTSHYWISPLQSEEIQKDTCAKCHDTSTLKSMVEGIQKETRERETELADKLVDLDAKLTEAVSSGSKSEEELNEIRQLYRDGEFYWDFVYVENSEGAHNSALTKDTLDKAEEKIDEALEKLK